MSHSKVVATGIICMAVIGSVIIYAKKDYFFAKNSQVAENIPTNVIGSSPQISNGDDWRKTLANISLATNSPVQIIASQNNGADSGSGDTLTDQISKQFFSLYLKEKKNGVTIDQNEAMNIANKTINNLNLTLQAKKYEIKDIKITQDVSKTARDKYAKALLSAANQSSAKNIADTLGILEIAIKSQNDTDLAKMDSIIKGYQDIISSTLLIEVPRDNVPSHMVYLNTLSSILNDVQGMRQFLVDPMTGYIAFSNYQSHTIKLAVVMNNMNTYFTH